MPANAEPANTEPAAATRILLVEDDDSYAYLLRRLVEAEGEGEFLIEEVNLLSRALEKCEREEFGCILLDLHLPDSTGLATFREVSRKAGGVPIVVLSGLDDQRIAVQAVRDGAQDYMVKASIDGPVILRSIRYAIERHQTQEHWRHLSLEDELTGLYNRRGFITLGEQQLKLARRRKHPLLVLFIDLDGLKQINDSLGHETGNRAILDTAALLGNCFRESDVIARLGGDEFVVLLDGVDQSGFRDLSVRLREQVDALNRQGKRLFQLTMSWGTAEFDPDDPCTLEELVKKADLAMYAMKRKNRA